MNKVLFIHRSVGRDLLKHGRLRELLNSKDIALDDYHNNSGVLTHNDGSTLSSEISMPGDNTNPDNLADYFTDWPELLQGYGLVMIKSCYPNSHIKNYDQLEVIKTHYESIFRSFQKHNQQLLVLTSPPLRPLFTNQTEAGYACELAEWLSEVNQPNIHVYDLHGEYSDNKGRHRGMLKRFYRRIAPWDNHPNSVAHQQLAPKLAESISKILV